MGDVQGRVGVSTSHVRQVAEVFAKEAGTVREQHALVQGSPVSKQSAGRGFTRHGEIYWQHVRRLTAAVEAFGVHTETIGSVLLESAGDYQHTEGGNRQSFLGR